jgi:hypothetical protein
MTSARVRVDGEDRVNGYPIQPGKVQTPAIRDETLARTHPLDWLDVKIHSRVVFVIADAGHGKTTLLADFARRTRLRTLWYRRNEEDRDCVGFLSHLVASGREHDPGFAPSTSALLRSLEPGGTTREDAIETFQSEIGQNVAERLPLGPTVLPHMTAQRRSRQPPLAATAPISSPSGGSDRPGAPSGLPRGRP